MINSLIEQAHKCELTAIDYLLQASRMRAKLMEECGLDSKDFLKDAEPIQVPFAAYETQLERFQEEKRELLDRHDAEKDKMRKHYRNIVIAVCSVLIALIVGLFGTVIYLFDNFDFATIDLSQGITFNDGTGTIEDGIEYNQTK